MTQIVDKDTGEVIEAEESTDATFSEMIATYIKLRDKKAALKKEHEGVLKKYDTAMDEIGEHLKGVLATQKIRAISCAEGVAFIHRKRSATVADTGAFREYVIENKNFDLADFRAKVEAVEDFIKEHDGQLPPGTNFRVFETVRVNRN